MTSQIGFYVAGSGGQAIDITTERKRWIKTCHRLQDVPTRLCEHIHIHQGQHGLAGCVAA
eukprot:164057-Amphidinium_carterae.1